MTSFIHFSAAFEAGVASDPPIMRPQIDCLSHVQIAGHVAAFFDGLRQEGLAGAQGRPGDSYT